MGISRRKAGTVVQCPRCAGQVIVPDDPQQSKAGNKTQPRQQAKAGAGKSPAKSAGEVFEGSDIDKLLQQEPIAYNPSHQTVPSDQSGKLAPHVHAAHAPVVAPPPAGILLTPGKMTVLAVTVVLLIGAAFFAGFLVGRM